MDAITLSTALVAARKQSAARRSQPVSVWNRAQPCGTNLTNGATASLTTKIQHQVMTSGSGIVLVYLNTYDVNGQEVFGPQTLSIQATVEAPEGSLYPVFFRGSRTGVVEPGGVLMSDPIGIDYLKGDITWTRTFVSAADAATKFPIGNVRAYGAKEGATYGANNIDSGTGTGAAGIGFGPAAILGTPYPQATPVVGAIHDSIGFGTGDYSSDLGFLHRALSTAQLPHQRIGMPSEQLAYFVQPKGYRSRFPLLNGATDVVEQLGVNDFRGGRNLTQMRADMVTVWRAIQRRGSRGWRTTITPAPSASTDRWVTVAGQTPHANDAVRTAVNAWLRDGAPLNGTTPAATGTTGSGISRATVYNANCSVAQTASGPAHLLAGIFDLAAAVESATTPGTWATPDVRTVTDAAITTGTTVLTSATANFTAADLGGGVAVNGAGTAGAALTGNIIAVTNATTVSLSTSAGTTVSGAIANLGTPTTDGLHPSGVAHQRMANAIPVALFTP